MAQVTLEKLLRKNKALQAALLTLAGGMGGELGVQDADGALLLGRSMGAASHSAPVELNGAVLGRVASDAAPAPLLAALAQMLATIAAQEAEKRALGAELLDKYRELNLLYTLSERLLVEPDPQAIATLALAEAGRVIQTTAGWLLLADGDDAVILSHTGRELSLKPGLGARDSLLHEVLASREAEIRNNAPAADYFDESPVDAYALLCAPLKTEQRVLGAILLAAEAPAAYTARDLKLLNTVALQVAPALEMARLYQVAVEQGRMERELQLAYQVQAGLIPARAPQIAGWQFAGHWRPARELSGDYYDFIDAGDGCLGLVIGDVADKGMPSALFMVHARAAVRTAVRYRDPPAQAIFEANELVHPESKRGHFVTLFYARLDTASGRLTYVNAGHNPPLLYDASNRQFRELTLTGYPLGLMDAARYGEGRAMLAPGDVLVMYTDGLTEAVDASGNDFGEERLQDLIRRNAHLPAAEVSASMAGALEEFAGDAPPFDDLTLLVVKREIER